MTWYFQSPHAPPPAPISSFPVAQNLPHLDNLKQPERIFDNLWKSWTSSHNLKQSWTASENLGQPQTILDNLWESWTTWKNLGQPMAALNNYGKPWTISENLTALDNIRQSWRISDNLWQRLPTSKTFSIQEASRNSASQKSLKQVAPFEHPLTNFASLVKPPTTN